MKNKGQQYHGALPYKQEVEGSSPSAPTKPSPVSPSESASTEAEGVPAKIQDPLFTGVNDGRSVSHLSPIVRIDVTAQDIEAGEQVSAWKCPIALAMKRALGQPVGVAQVYWQFSGRYPANPLPAAVAHWISEFDRPGGKERVKPFSFDVEVPA